MLSLSLENFDRQYSNLQECYSAGIWNNYSHCRMSSKIQEISQYKLVVCFPNHEDIPIYLLDIKYTISQKSTTHASRELNGMEVSTSEACFPSFLILPPGSPWFRPVPLLKMIMLPGTWWSWLHRSRWIMLICGDLLDVVDFYVQTCFGLQKQSMGLRPMPLGSHHHDSNQPVPVPRRKSRFLLWGGQHVWHHLGFCWPARLGDHLGGPRGSRYGPQWKRYIE